MKRYFIVLLLFFCTHSITLKAAFPITRVVQTEQFSKNNFSDTGQIATKTLYQQPRNTYRNTSNSQNDSGVMGVVSLLLGVAGMLMPVEAAILSLFLFLPGFFIGVSGSNRNRKLKALAILGMIINFIGIIVAVALIAAGSLL